jgi:hypothetical protein
VAARVDARRFAAARGVAPRGTASAPIAVRTARAFRAMRRSSAGEIS